MSDRKNWSKEDIQKLIGFRKHGKTASQIAETLNLTVSQVSNAVQKYCPKIQATPAQDKSFKKTSHQEDMDEARAQVKEEAGKDIQKKYGKLLKEKVLADRLVDLWRDTIKPFSPNIKPIAVPKFKGEPETAVLLLSDIHVGQVVLPSQTNGFGNYSPMMYLSRLAYLENTVVHILRNHLRAPTDKLVVILLGDIVHGCLNHGAEKEHSIVVAQQFELAIWSLTQFFLRLSQFVPVEVRCAAVGNHGRWPNQRKMPTTNRFSNLDYLLYSALHHSMAMAEGARVEVKLDYQPGAVIDIKSTRFLARHGDHLKGGDQQFGVPIHSMAREVMSTSQRYAAAGLKPIDYFLVGDKHKLVFLPLATGGYIINGSFVGTDDFSMAESFTPVEPIQLMFGIHPKIKKTWQYDLRLSPAPLLKETEIPYAVSPNIKELLSPYL